jgi:hypothetical protein
VRLRGWLVIVAGLALGCSRGSKKAPEGSSSAGAPATVAPAVSAPDGAVPAAPTGSAPPAVSGTLVYGWDGVPAPFAPETRVNAATAADVIRQVFPLALPGPDRCPDNPPPLSQARARGTVAPRVERMRAGSFSAPGASEMLFDVAVRECGATHADNWGTHRLVLLGGGKIISDLPLAGRLAGSVDLDGDGRHEILVQGSGTGQGVTAVTLTVARLEPSGLVTVKDLGVVYEGTCGSRDPDGEEVTLVSVSPGRLDFTARKAQRACR